MIASRVPSLGKLPQLSLPSGKPLIVLAVGCLVVAGFLLGLGLERMLSGRQVIVVTADKWAEMSIAPHGRLLRAVGSLAGADADEALMREALVAIARLKGPNAGPAREALRAGRALPAAELLAQSLTSANATGPEAAAVWTSLGVLLARTAPARAIEAHRQAILADPGHLPAHQRLAETLLVTGKLAEADAAWAVALKLATERGDKAGEALALAEQGDLARMQGYTDKASGLLGKAVTLAEEAGAIGPRLRALSGLARVAATQGALDKIEAPLTGAVQLAADKGTPEQHARALIDLAAHQSDVRQFEAAAQTLAQALTLARESGWRLGTAWAKTGLAQLAKAQGNLSLAADLAREAIAIHTEIGHDWGRASAHGILGAAALARKDAETAEQAFQRALEIARSLGQATEIAEHARQLGSLAESAKGYERALELYREALDLDERMNFRAGAARDHSLIGDVRFALEQFEEARSSYDRAHELAKALGDKRLEVAALTRIGSSDVIIGDKRKGCESLKEAIGLAGESKDKQGLELAQGLAQKVGCRFN